MILNIMANLVRHFTFTILMVLKVTLKKPFTILTASDHRHLLLPFVKRTLKKVMIIVMKSLSITRSTYMV